MTGDTHYDLETLAELAEGLLDAATAARVREHLAVCDPCGERLADLAAVREVLAAVPVPAMPMGVALRVDRAIAAEAERRAAGLVDPEPALAEPDWDRILQDAPWEQAAREGRDAQERAENAAQEQEREEAPAREPERPRLGVVAEDGTVRPARRREDAVARPARRPRRRLWALPASIAAAGALVGALTVSGLLAGNGGAAPQTSTALGPAESGATATEQPAEGRYAISESDYNYTDKQLRGPVMPLFAARGPIVEGGSSVEAKITNCLDRLTDQNGAKPFIVDKGYYNGQEAVITAFWENKAANSVLVRVVSPDCEELRRPTLTTWN